MYVPSVFLRLINGRYRSSTALLVSKLTKICIYNNDDLILIKFWKAFLAIKKITCIIAYCSQKNELIAENFNF